MEQIEAGNTQVLLGDYLSEAMQNRPFLRDSDGRMDGKMMFIFSADGC